MYKRQIVYTVLKVLYEDTAFNEASREERPLRVAMIDGAAQRREELEEYCRMNMLIPEIVPCDTEEEMLQALKENRADVSSAPVWNLWKAYGPVSYTHLDVYKRQVGSRVEADVRGRRVEAQVVELPFYKRQV